MVDYYDAYLITIFFKTRSWISKRIRSKMLSTVTFLTAIPCVTERFIENSVRLAHGFVYACQIDLRQGYIKNFLTLPYTNVLYNQNEGV